MKSHARDVRWGAAMAVFAVLGTLTAVVWRQQVTHQRTLLSRHAEDVCVQAARRAEVFLESYLAVAELFAKRWATHESQDYSRRRFEEFAEVVIAEQSGYHGVGLVTGSEGDTWVVPRGDGTLARYVRGEGHSLLADVRRTHQAMLSPPFELATGERSIFAVLPALRRDELVGVLVVEVRLDPLFAELFHHRIRAEFAFEIQDSGRSVYRFGPELPPGGFEGATIRAASSLSVWNRRWHMVVVPRPAALASVGFGANMLIPMFGGLLSLAFGVLTFLLMSRIAASRRARDEALREVAERRRAERALRASEQRYRSVFDSASEGLLVLDLDGRVQEANDAACTMHGYPPGGLAGLNVRELIADDHQHKYETFLERLAQEGIVALESVDVCKDGRRIDVEVRGARFLHEGEPAALAILTDVTERKAALRQQQQLSRQVLQAQEEERARLSRDLHDGLGQTLTALRFELDWLSRKAKVVGTDGADAFVQATGLVESSAKELRRMCKGLRPPLLDDLGLVPAVTQLVEEYGEHTGIAVELEVDLDEDEVSLAPEICLCAYRVLQEALTNVQRHARARHVDITLQGDRRSLRLSVYDDGEGFEMSDPSTHTHFGIAGMQERAKLVSGALELRSKPGEGTRVVLRLPGRPAAGRGATTEQEEAAPTGNAAETEAP